MGFLRYSELLTGSSGRSRIDMSDSQLTYSIHKRNTAGSVTAVTHSISLRLSLRVCQAAKLVVGDRIEFLYDLSKSAGRLEKVDLGGHKLSKSGDNGAIIRLPYIPASRLPLVDHPVGMENVTIVDGGIEFRFPAHLTKGKGLAAAAAELEEAEATASQ